MSMLLSAPLQMILLHFYLYSGRLEVVGARKNGQARGRPRVSPSRAPVLSCAH